MNTLGIPSLIVILFSIGCSTVQPTSTISNRISLCNAGAKISLSGNLEAKMQKNSTLGLALSAGVESDLKGYFLNHAQVTGDSAVELYREYLNCINQIRIYQ